MKKILVLTLALVLTALPLSACGAPQATPSEAAPAASAEAAPAESADAPEASGEPVTLTMGSWRADDVKQMETLFAQYKEKTNVTIQFQPINPPDYNATLRMQLESGTGPDMFYSRSYATSLELFEQGYIADISALAGLKDTFTADALAPWSTADGVNYGVPFIAVSHAVYYNKDLFKANGIEVPKTYEEFLAICDKLKAAGVTPLANGLADEWDILEVFFLNMLPNYVGGSAERAKYENKELPLNDANFVAAYTDIAKVAPYLPEGFEAVTYNDSQALFAGQQAAMFADGSWTVGVYDDAAFDWGVFSIPAPAGKSTRVTFHADAGLSINKATKNQKAAEDFLAWVITQEGASIAYNLMPKGFFPLTKTPIALNDAHSNEFLQLNSGKETDVRFIWPKMIDMYSPMNQAVIGVIKGTMTPQAAADSVNDAYAAK